jgi:glycosyltransferase involved in cell wall biosynthesis
VARLILLLSPGGTGGWRANEAALAASLGRLGYEAEVVAVAPGRLHRLRRFWAAGALLVAWRSRRALQRALGGSVPAALIAVNPTSALLLPRRRLAQLGVPVAIRIDAPAPTQYPGALHIPHRWLERRALRAADAVLTMGPSSTAATEPFAGRIAEVPFGVRIDPAPATDPGEAKTVVAYTGQPQIKGLDTIARAWAALGATRGRAEIVVTGVEAGAGANFLRLHGIAEPPGWRWGGSLERGAYEELLRGAAAFVSASRLEGHGIAQLEALAAGVPLVTTTSAGAYEARPLAVELSPDLCTDGDDPGELGGAISRALSLSPQARADYAERAATLLAPFAAQRVDPALAAALASLGVATPAARDGERAAPAAPARPA